MAIETKNQTGIILEENVSGNGVVPVEKTPVILLDHAGFIAVKSTYETRQPLREVSRGLVERGVTNQADRLDVVREIHKARQEMGLGRIGPKNRS